jgi:hypothetical protein
MTSSPLMVLGSLVVSLRTLGLIIFVFTNMILVILAFMLIYMVWRKAHEKNYSKYRLVSGLHIRRTVFYDGEIDPETGIPLTGRLKRMIVKKIFRRLFTEELISAKKNINGAAAINLKHLYHQLTLESYALKKLSRDHWHIKAKAIQELTLMDMRELKDDLFAYTNDRNELVRMEAQVAMVQFNGFEGLRFLDTISYSISEWQQIKLLQKLSNLPPVQIEIDGWLKSSNASVVVFALKLARNYHRFELHDIIITCLDHTDPQIRLQAIHCLGIIYTDETSVHLISRFWREGLPHQLAMIAALQNIGSEKDNTFLGTLLNNDNYEIKLNAARALASSGLKGLAILNDHGASDVLLSNIITQVRGEIAA